MTEQHLTEQELAAIEADLSCVRLLPGESRRRVERLTGEIRRLQEQEKRLCVLVAWEKSGMYLDEIEAVFRILGLDPHDTTVDDRFKALVDGVVALGRALVEEQQQKEATE